MEQTESLWQFFLILYHTLKFFLWEFRKSYLLLCILFAPYTSQSRISFLSRVWYTWRKSWLETYEWYATAVLMCSTSDFKAWYLRQHWCRHLLKPTRPGRHTQSSQTCFEIRADNSVSAWYSSPCCFLHISSCTCIQVSTIDEVLHLSHRFYKYHRSTPTLSRCIRPRCKLKIVRKKIAKKKKVFFTTNKLT